MIAKPYRSEELAARVRGVLAARHPPAAAGRGGSRTPTPPPSDGPAAAGAARRGRGRAAHVDVDMLERLGCLVAGVGSGEQALELLARAAIVRPAAHRSRPAGNERRGAGGRGAPAVSPACRWSSPAATARAQTPAAGRGPAVHRQALFLDRPAAGARPGRPDGAPPRRRSCNRSVARRSCNQIDVWRRSYGNSAAPGEGDAMRIADLPKSTPGCTRSHRRGACSTANCWISMSRS